MSNSKSSSKPLKGNQVIAGSGTFDTLQVKSLIIDNLSIAGVFEDNILNNVKITNSQIENTIIGLEQPNQGFFTILQTGESGAGFPVNFYSNTIGDSVNWDPTQSLLTVNGEFLVRDCSTLGKIKICNNRIRSLDTTNGMVLDTLNGSILLDPEAGRIPLDIYTFTNSTSNNVIITSLESHYLKVGDTITINNSSTIPVMDGVFTVASILGDNSFSINDTTIITTTTSLGNFIRSISNSVFIPKNIPLDFGNTSNSIFGNTSGIFITNNLHFSTIGTNWISNSQFDDGIYINSKNISIYDPIPYIGYFPATNDGSDRGFQFNYFNTSGNSVLGFFGLDTSTQRFTFFTEAVNNNEIITGLVGDLQFKSLYVDNIFVSNTGNVDFSCGNISNLSSISACGNGLRISAGNINLNNEVSLNFGSAENFIRNSNGNLLFSSDADLIFTSANTFIHNSGSLNLGSDTINLVSTANFYWENANAFLGIDSNSDFILSNSNGNIFLTPENSVGSINIPAYNHLNFANSDNWIYSDGTNLFFSAINAISLDSDNLSLGADNISLTSTANFLWVSTGSTIASLGFGSNNDFLLMNTVGNINLTPENSIGSINIPEYNHLNFANSDNWIYSDGMNLFLSSPNTVDITSPIINLDGSVQITGNLNVLQTTINTDAYILPLGTYYYNPISSITNFDTIGNVQIDTLFNHYLTVGDSITLLSTNSSPTIDQIFSVASILDDDSFVVFHGTPLVSSGNFGTVKSDLVFEQGKDVGIQVNYWDQSGGNTWGSSSYLTGFFGFKRNTERWTFYRDGTNTNDVFTGNLGDIEANKAFLSNISGFTLDGTLTGNSQGIYGSNFSISGGNINNTPIGLLTPSEGFFTNLSSNNVSFNNATIVNSNLTTSTISNLIANNLTSGNSLITNLSGNNIIANNFTGNNVYIANQTIQNLNIVNSLSYSIERLLLSGGLLTSNPTLNNALTLIGVNGLNIQTSGTMPSSGLYDGQVKMFILSTMGNLSTYTLEFPPNTLLASNANNTSNGNILFKRQGQSVQLIWDDVGGKWMNFPTGAFIR